MSLDFPELAFALGVVAGIAVSIFVLVVGMPLELFELRRDLKPCVHCEKRLIHVCGGRLLNA